MTRPARPLPFDLDVEAKLIDVRGVPTPKGGLAKLRLTFEVDPREDVATMLMHVGRDFALTVCPAQPVLPWTASQPAGDGEDR